MTKRIKQYLLTALFIGFFDALWLGLVARSFYQAHIGSLLSQEPNMLAAVLFYIIYVLGVVVFVVAPAVEKGRLRDAALYGALFGLVAYATYDLTNLATLEGFSAVVVVVDLAWGAFLTSASAVLAYITCKERR